MIPRIRVWEIRSLKPTKCLAKNLASSRRGISGHAAPFTARVAGAQTRISRGVSFHNSYRLTPQSFQKQVFRFSHAPAQEKHRAFVALGSNLGDRIAMIEDACKEMEAGGNIKIARTSSLWETDAMYVLDQNKFVNGACEVRCTSGWSPPLTCVDRNITVAHRASR